MSVLRPDLMIKCCIPVVMAGIIAVCTSITSSISSQNNVFVLCAQIYGLVVSVLISGNRMSYLPVVPIVPLKHTFFCLVAPRMPLFTGFIHLGAGLSVGLAGLAAGFAIGIVGDAGVRGTAQQPRLFVGMVSQS